MSETILSAKVVETFINGQKYVGFEIQTDVKTHRLCVEERSFLSENHFVSLDLTSYEEEFRWFKYVKNDDDIPGNDDEEEYVIVNDAETFQNELDKIVGWQHCVFQIRCDPDECTIILSQNNSLMMEFSVCNNNRRTIKCYVESGDFRSPFNI